MAKKTVDLSAFGFGSVELTEEFIALALMNGMVAEVEIVPENPPQEEESEDLPEYLQDDPCYAPGYQEREMVISGMWRVTGNRYEVTPSFIQIVFNNFRQLAGRLDHNPPTHLSLQLGMAGAVASFLTVTTPGVYNKEFGLLSAELLIAEELTRAPNMPRKTLAELRTNWFGA